MYMVMLDQQLDLSLTSHSYEGELQLRFVIAIDGIAHYVIADNVLKLVLVLCCRDYAEDSYALHTLYYLGLTMLAR
jgi:hypothetical protein